MFISRRKYDSMIDRLGRLEKLVGQPEYDGMHGQTIFASPFYHDPTGLHKEVDDLRRLTGHEKVWRTKREGEYVTRKVKKNAK